MRIAGYTYSVRNSSRRSFTITFTAPLANGTSSGLVPGVFANASVTYAIPTPLLTNGFSTAQQTDVQTGNGQNQVEYNVNAPVSVDGGTGFNKLVVLGTEFADHIVVTNQGVFGAGLNVSYVNI